MLPPARPPRSPVLPSVGLQRSPGSAGRRSGSPGLPPGSLEQLGLSPQQLEASPVVASRSPGVAAGSRVVAKLSRLVEIGSPVVATGSRVVPAGSRVVAKTSRHVEMRLGVVPKGLRVVPTRPANEDWALLCCIRSASCGFARSRREAKWPADRLEPAGASTRCRTEPRWRLKVSSIRPAEPPVVAHEDPGRLRLVAVEESDPDVPGLHLVVEDVGEDRVEPAGLDALAEFAGELLDVGAGGHLGKEVLAEDVFLLSPRKVGLGLVVAEDPALPVQADGAEGKPVEILFAEVLDAFDLGAPDQVAVTCPWSPSPRWALPGRAVRANRYGADILPESAGLSYGDSVTEIPEIRVRACNQGEVRPGGDFVLYWMIASRRLGWSFALDRAAEHARRLGKPLVILEPLRCGYRWASDRIHRFVLEGMAEHAAAPRGIGRSVLPLRGARAWSGEGVGGGAGRAGVRGGDGRLSGVLPAAHGGRGGGAGAGAARSGGLERSPSPAGGGEGLRDGRPLPALPPEGSARASWPTRRPRTPWPSRCRRASRHCRPTS